LMGVIRGDRDQQTVALPVAIAAAVLVAVGCSTGDDDAETESAGDDTIETTEPRSTDGEEST
jgi:hypothetical protein